MATGPSDNWGMRLTRHLVGGAVLASLLYGTPSVGHADTIVFDNFDDGSLNTSLWAPVTRGNGSVSGVGGHLVATVLPSLDHWSGAAAFVVLLGTIAGDFDVRVRYELLEPLPLTHGDTGGGIFGGPLSFSQYGVARDVRTTGDGPGAVYDNAYVGMVGGGEDEIPTGDPVGALRLTRDGSSFSAYYWGSRAECGTGA